MEGEIRRNHHENILTPELLNEISTLDFISFQDQISLILVLEKFAPACEVDFSWMANKNISKTEFENNIQKLKNILDQCHCYYSFNLQSWEYSDEVLFAEFYVAQEKDYLSKLQKAFEDHDSAAIGKLLEYPPTAIDGFINNNRIDENSLPDEVSLSPEYKFLNFKMSAKNWPQELEAARKRAEAIKAISPEVYQHIINQK